MRNLPLILLANAACALALSACGAKKDAADDQPKLTAEVTTAVLTNASLDQTATAYGAAEFAPNAERTLATPVEAKVTQVLAGPGTRVAAGQSVILLSPSPQTEVDLKKAGDDAKTAQAAYDRAVRLKASGLDSNADVETARAANTSAQAVYQSLQSRLSALTVKSPVDGVVETVTATPGDLAASGASLGKVGRLGAVRVRLGLEPSELGLVHAGERVRLEPAAGGPSRFGQVASVSPVVDAQTKLAAVIVQADGWAPGQTVKGDILVGHSSGPVAPQGAVYYDQDQPYVLVVDHGVAHKRNVKLGVEQGDSVELVSGVNAGDRIVVVGGASLDDGTAVKEAVAAQKDAG
jgi:RND family efflux transporter MFP subunit